jgi:hypothetical protein
MINLNVVIDKKQNIGSFRCIHLWPYIGQLRHILIILIQIDISIKDKCHVYLAT